MPDPIKSKEGVTGLFEGTGIAIGSGGSGFGSQALCAIFEFVDGVPSAQLEATLGKIEGVFELTSADPVGESATYTIAAGAEVTFGLADGIGDAEHTVTGKLYDLNLGDDEITELGGEVELDGHLGVVRGVTFTVPAVADGHAVVAGLTVTADV